jgi:hypothetical protein
VFIEHVDGQKGAHDGGKGHRPSSGAYGRGRIASERGRRPCCRRQIEGDYVDEHIGSLQICVLVGMHFKVLPYAPDHRPRTIVVVVGRERETY